MGIGAVIGGVGSLVSGFMGSSAASDAADAQVQAQQQALAAQKDMFGVVQKNLQPYMAYGTDMMKGLQAALPGLTAKFAPTMAQLEATPGYQFTLGQGMKALNNNFAAQGLGGTSAVWGAPGADGTAPTSGPQGPSGALGKALTDYVTGQASNTFQQQFQNYWGQNKSIYDMLAGGLTVGANAAAGVGNAATSTGQGLANTYSNIGTAQGTGILGGQAALSSGISGLTGSAQSALLYNSMNPGGGGGFGSLFGGGGSPSGLNSLFGDQGFAGGTYFA